MFLIKFVTKNKSIEIKKSMKANFIIGKINLG